MKLPLFFPILGMFFIYPWIPLVPTETGQLYAKIKDLELNIRVAQKICRSNCCLIDLYKTLQIHCRYPQEVLQYETARYYWNQVSLEDSGKFVKGFVSDNLLFFVLYGSGGDFLVCRLPDPCCEKKTPIMLYNSRGHVGSQVTSVQFPDNETVHIINKEKTILFSCNTARYEYKLLVPYDIEVWTDYMGCC